MEGSVVIASYNEGEFRWRLEHGMQQALRAGREDSLFHANEGWRLLGAGDQREAERRFREALRLDPNCEYAREGVIAALKARHFAYRVILAWSFRMGSSFVIPLSGTFSEPNLRTRRRLAVVMVVIGLSGLAAFATSFEAVRSGLLGAELPSEFPLPLLFFYFASILFFSGIVSILRLNR
jgi:hypothetical protein